MCSTEEEPLECLCREKTQRARLLTSITWRWRRRAQAVLEAQKSQRRRGFPLSEPWCWREQLQLWLGWEHCLHFSLKMHPLFGILTTAINVKVKTEEGAYWGCLGGSLFWTKAVPSDLLNKKSSGLSPYFQNDTKWCLLKQIFVQRE